MTTKKKINLHAIKCAWTTPVLGVEGNLLYYGPLLEELSNKFSRFTVYTSEYKGNTSNSKFDIKLVGKFKRLYKNERFTKSDTDKYVSGISISSPAILKSLIKDKCDLIIINEFSLYSLYSALSKFFTKSKILCVVETRPRFEKKITTQLPRYLMRKFITQFVNAFITNNKDGLDYLVNDLGVPKNKIIAKPYLVSDLAKNHSDISGGDDNNLKIKLLYVGQLIFRKGLHLAIESLNNLPDAYNDIYEFNIVGDGPQREELESLVTQYKLQNNVIFHGRVDYEQLPEFYMNADIFIFPTLSDYRALSPFEALSYRLPILASIHDGGITETVHEGLNGFSFDPKNTDELTQILTRIFDDKDMIKRFSEQSREIARSYTLDSAISALTEACELAISDHD